jgi:hypothetical protein
MNPLKAMFRLVEAVIDGGECTNCHRGTGISDTWDMQAMPMESEVCWWKYDPEQESFKRSCDGKKPGPKK